MTLECVPSETDIPRVLGCYRGGAPGPLVICIGGMHGNEPAGIFAARQVLHDLSSTRPAFRGRFLALSGNRTALIQRRRYIGHDLNRMWTAERINMARTAGAKLSENPEEREQHELLMAIDLALADHQGPVVFLDLHTTSAAGIPFSVIADTILNRRLAMSLPAPVILGLEEYLDGTTLNYMNDLGYLAVGFEGGQNESLSAVDHHKVAIWTTLAAVGCLRSEDLFLVSSLRQQLEERTKTAPQIVEIRHRHAIHEGDDFVMEPGFSNFHPVQRGQLLAHDRHGEIRAREDGFILMPLYQNQGVDGFFLVREVRLFWLHVATWCRRLRLEYALPWLPGIRRHPTLPETLLINPRIARWLVVEILHLLGFRKQRPEGNCLVASRRPHEVFSFEEWQQRAPGKEH